MARGCGKKGSKALNEKKAKKKMKTNSGWFGSSGASDKHQSGTSDKNRSCAVQKKGLRKASRDDLLAIAKQAGYEYGAETSPDDLSKIYIEVFKRLEHGLLYDFSTKPH